MHSKFVTALSLCAGLLFSATSQAAVEPLDRVAAIVDNDVVMASQVNERMASVRQQLAQNGAEAPAESELRSQQGSIRGQKRATSECFAPWQSYSCFMLFR